MDFLHLLREIAEYGWGALAVLWALFLHFHTLKSKKDEIENKEEAIRNKEGEIKDKEDQIRWRNKEISKLNEEKRELEDEIHHLRDESHTEAIKLVAGTIERVNPPMCPVCKQLLLLRFTTTFFEAIKQLSVLPRKISQAAAGGRLDRLVVRETLEQIVLLRLWHPHLGNKDPVINNPEQQLIEQAIGAYAALVFHMPDEEKEKAVRFYVEDCAKGSQHLQREAARKLLPRLLVESRGHSSLIDAYRELFVNLRELRTEAEKTLLAAVFGGLQVAVEVNSRNVGDIWAQAFTVATQNVGWAWEDAKIGTSWCIAMEKRMLRSDLDERKSLRSLIGSYLISPEAPSHAHSYHEIARLFYIISHSIEKKSTPFRVPDRAIVKEENLPIHIAFKDGTPSPVIHARLINFSLNDLDGRIKGRGAWATASLEQQWPEQNGWRDATVAVQIPGEGNAQFDHAEVWGPIPEGKGAGRYYGFRIKLGGPSTDDSILPLKSRWNEWYKR